MLSQLERFIRAAIVDRNPQSSSAALVAGYQLLPAAPELVRRWGADVQGVLSASGSGPMVQYHALGLLYGMRKGDKLSVAKLVSSLTSYVALFSLICCVVLFVCVSFIIV